jgi:NitT/TauT family transport system ATP-binding protein
MSKQPGRIIRALKVPFKRPRPVSIVGSFDFTRMKSEIMGILFIC